MGSVLTTDCHCVCSNQVAKQAQPSTEQMTKRPARSESGSPKEGLLTTTAQPESPGVLIDTSHHRAIIDTFWAAVETGDDAVIHDLLLEHSEHSWDLLHEQTHSSGADCLQIAVEKHNTHLIVFLLMHGVSPNVQNSKTGDTALHIAVRQGAAKIVALLSQKRADCSITNFADETPFDLAIEARNVEIQEILSEETQQAIHERLASNAGSRTSRSSRSTSAAELPVKSSIQCGVPSPGSGMRRPLSTILSPELEAMATDVLAGAATPDVYQNAAEKEAAERELQVAGEKARISLRNPFTKLGAGNSRRLLVELEALCNQKESLPDLSAWLEKRRPEIPHSWQRRWVVVRGSHILWSDKQRTIDDAKDPQQRKQFNNWVNIMHISDIQAITKGKTQRKFQFVVERSRDHGKRREYVWRCSSEQDRAFWVEGLLQHQAQMKQIVAYLGTAAPIPRFGSK